MLARLYPRETDIITHDDVITSLIELCGVGKVAFYTSTARKEVFGCFPHWYDHQRIRDSKKKCPDPTDTEINDWYYRRFIPLDMKIKIMERDNCKCTICKKDLNPEKVPIKRLIKMYINSVHFDHIVPCNQGGRATYENIQTTCPKCNLSRKRFYTFDEILLFSAGEESLQKVAASCGELPPNPIQSESNPNPNPNPISFTDTFNLFWNMYPKKSAKKDAVKAWNKIKLTEDLMKNIMYGLEKSIKSVSWVKDGGQFIPNAATWLIAERWNDEVQEAQVGLFADKPKLNKREQQLEDLGRIMDDYDRCNSQKATDDVFCELPEPW